jgi:hypothetical protein
MQWLLDLEPEAMSLVVFNVYYYIILTYDIKDDAIFDRPWQ